MNQASCPSAARAGGAAIRLEALRIRLKNETLLDQPSARFEPGQITLIVGASGAGKSLLLRAIAGLPEPSTSEVTVTGRVVIESEQSDHRAKQPPTVGFVFQSFALFDELSPLGNVRFAYAHRSVRTSKAGQNVIESQPESLLSELQVPPSTRTAWLSGGQKQRLAIARALAYDPDVLLYDEPTSGLDPASAARVALLIQATHSQHPKTSIIVTHDYESLAPIADKVYLLDPATRSLLEIDRTELDGLTDRLMVKGQPAAADSSALRSGASTVSKIAGRVADLLAGTSRILESIAWFPVRLLPIWKSVGWGFRLFLHYLRLVAGLSAWVYLAVAGAIAGFVATYFTFRFLPYRPYTEPLIVEDLLHALGFSLYRILVPVLATILIAARCGAAVAADVGSKVYGQQVDALRSFGVLPERYLWTGIIYAFLLGTPLLVLMGFTAARLTSLVVFAATHSELGPFFWDAHFHRQLRAPGSSWYQGSGWLLAKVLLCAAGTGCIAYDLGSRPKHSGRDVSAGVTRTILWSTLFVLAVHFVFAFYEFE